MIEARSYPLTVQSVQPVQTPMGSTLACAYTNANGAPRIVFLVDPKIDAIEDWEVLLIGEGQPNQQDLSLDGWMPAGTSFVSTWGQAHCFARRLAS